jgi:hypothetical protein
MPPQTKKKNSSNEKDRKSHQNRNETVEIFETKGEKMHNISDVSLLLQTNKKGKGGEYTTLILTSDK